MIAIVVVSIGIVIVVVVVIIVVVLFLLPAVIQFFQHMKAGTAWVFCVQIILFFAL
jgi:hypothetical protein